MEINFAFYFQSEIHKKSVLIFVNN